MRQKRHFLYGHYSCTFDVNTLKFWNITAVTCTIMYDYVRLCTIMYDYMNFMEHEGILHEFT